MYVFHIKMDLIFQKFFFSAFSSWIVNFLITPRMKEVACKGQRILRPFLRFHSCIFECFTGTCFLLSNMKKMWGDEVSTKKSKRCSLLLKFNVVISCGDWFSSVQSLSHVQLFVTPWTKACETSLSITNSRSPPKPMSIESMMLSNHSLPSPSPPAPNPSQHQGLFQWVSSLHQEAKVLEFQLQHQSFQWALRTDL